jgi:MoaA/NifB/PqqE/SkfB family radical SAM enzyme
MVAVQNIQGLKREWFLLRLKASIFFHFLADLFTGDLSPRRLLLLLRRLLFFLSRLQHNKFVKIGSHARLDLYVPNCSTPAFYTACRKFKAFHQKLPCSTVLLSVTSACRFACPHCYQKHDRGKDVPLDLLLEVVRKLQAKEVAFFNIEGGEPFLVYDRLKQICAAIDSRSEIWVNSTGDGMTLARLQELRSLNLTAVMFSLHSADPAKFNAFLGSDTAWAKLVQGIDLCHQADIPVSFNVCLERDGFYNGEFERVMERAKEFHACLIQLIKPKPSGGWLETGFTPFTQEDTDRVKNLVNQYNHDRAYIEYPAISAQILEEEPSVFGCTAGGTDRFYINAKGDVQPCEFLNISFGNLATEDFETIYERMRGAFVTPGENWLCEECAPLIRQLVRDHHLDSLPLNPELSQQVYRHWDKGRPTELYATIENRLK